jgi:hypothetical protein
VNGTPHLKMHPKFQFKLLLHKVFSCLSSQRPKWSMKKNETHPKTNHLEFIYVHINNGKIMTSPKPKLILSSVIDKNQYPLILYHASKVHLTLYLEIIYLKWCQMAIKFNKRCVFFLGFIFHLLKPWSIQKLQCSRPWIDKS